MQRLSQFLFPIAIVVHGGGVEPFTVKELIQFAGTELHFMHTIAYSIYHFTSFNYSFIHSLNSLFSHRSLQP